MHKFLIYIPLGEAAYANFMFGLLQLPWLHGEDMRSLKGIVLVSFLIFLIFILAPWKPGVPIRS